MGCERALRHKVVGRVAAPGMMAPGSDVSRAGCSRPPEVTAPAPGCLHGPSLRCSLRPKEAAEKAELRRQPEGAGLQSSCQVRARRYGHASGRSGDLGEGANAARPSPPGAGQPTCWEGKGQSRGGTLRGAPCPLPGLPPGSVPPPEQRCRSARSNTGRRQPQSLPF